MEDFLKRLGYSIARGVPQAATGFVDLAALPFTMSGMIKPEDVFLSTDYLTQKGLLPKPEQGLLNQTTELLSSAISPAAATKGAILATGGLLADAARVSGADLTPVGSIRPMSIFHGTDASFDEFNTPTVWFTDNKKLLESPTGYDGIGKPKYIMERTIDDKNLNLLDLSKESDFKLHESKFTDQLIDMGYDGVKYPASFRGTDENVYEIYQPGLAKLGKPEPKDLMFVKNVSPEALKKYDLLGGMPVPSIAVVQKDAPFEGFGDISLIGKPENFDPKLKGNVVYTSDIYSAREPKPFTLATKKADEMFLEDFREAFQVTRKDPRSTGIDTKLQKLQTKKKATGNQFDDVREWFRNSPEAKIKFLQDQGIEIPDLKDYDSLQMNYVLTEENDSLFRGFKGQSEFDKWSEKQMDKYFQGKKYFEYENPKYAKESARLSEIYNKTNDPNLMDAIDRQFERLERNRKKVAEYTAENITKVMKNMPTIGAEEGLGTSGIGRMRAGLTEKLTSLDDIRANKDLLLKEMYDNKQLTNNEIKREEIVQKLYEKTGADAENVKYMLPNLSENVNSFLVEAIDKGGKKKDFENAFKGSQFEKYLDDSLLAEMQDFAEGLRVSPVNYFEAKPQRTVDLSEFAGAVVPRGTAPEIISLLESKGLKVRDYDRFAKKSPYKTNQDRLDQRNTFTDQLFDLGGAGLAGLLGYQLLDDEDEISLGQIRI